MNADERHILWTPWRMTYLKRSKLTGCFICDAVKDTADEENLLLHRGRSTGIIMNRYPYINGHLLVAPNRHVASLVDLSPEELEDLFTWVRHAEEILRQAYHPDGFNIGINLGVAAGAGLKDHIHVHIMPRWVGDTNFMSTCGDVRVIPAELPDTYAFLKPFFVEKSESLKT